MSAPGSSAPGSSSPSSDGSAPVAPGAGPLLGPEFVRELEVLRRRLDVRARSGAAGDHVARRRGGASDFAQHRAYEPGDDLRRVDWNAYARSGAPVLKLFRAEEDVIVRLVCDASRSLDHGEPRKIDVARRLAAAVGYLALARSERAEVVVAGAGVVREHAPVRGRAGLPALLRALEAVEAKGGTDLARAIDAVVARSRCPGMLLVVSDFLDPGPVVVALERAAKAGHDVALAQILARDEIEPGGAPDFEGDLVLEDAETGALVELTVDTAALDAYARRLAELVDTLRGFARKHRASYLRVTTDLPLEATVRRLLARSVD
jgi:uncharacterized protein (DUF58 family)